MPEQSPAPSFLAARGSVGQKACLILGKLLNLQGLLLFLCETLSFCSCRKLGGHWHRFGACGRHGMSKGVGKGIGVFLLNKGLPPLFSFASFDKTIKITTTWVLGYLTRASRPAACPRRRGLRRPTILTKAQLPRSSERSAATPTATAYPTWMWRGPW